MKRLLFIDAATGRNIQVTVCRENEAEELAESLGAVFVEVGEGVTDSTHYVSGDALVEFPARPSPFHLWDWTAKAWVCSIPGLDAAKAQKREDVDSLKLQKLSLPIEYDGTLFDADAEAISNIRGVISRIARGGGLTDGWTGWRVADNSMVWASATDSEVLAHLNALASLIEDRTQAVLNSAWAHKDALSAMTDVETVVAYDVSDGWPV